MNSSGFGRTTKNIRICVLNFELRQTQVFNDVYQDLGCKSQMYTYSSVCIIICNLSMATSKQHDDVVKSKLAY